ncbi:MAG: aldehyde ferredoxin oxidoreductase family protein [Nitrospira sp.]|nr:aldehyde ferredoxin oxidoreductase family protein [Nitrospira sp.]
MATKKKVTEKTKKATKTNIYDYAGRILRVDLSKKKITKERVPEEVVRKFLGGEGLAAKILYDEVPPEIAPFHPENRVIFSNGLLSGTLAPASARMTLTTKSPNTEIYSDSNVGGHFGPELKYAGYDHIVFQGASEEPVYLWINDDTVELRDARHLWGKTTYETDTMIKNELGMMDIHIACIGPAGENLSGAACFIIDRGRACGRMGLGAVLGSKKMKAIAVKGTKGYKIFNPKEHIRICREFTEKILKDPYYKVMTIGTIGLTTIGYSGKGGRSEPMVRYGFTDKTFMPDFENISAENIKEKCWEHDMACFACPLHCANWTHVKEGPYAGVKGEGFELNVHEDSTYFDNTNPYFLAKWGLRCNELGLGVDEATLPIAFAMLLFDKGIISEEDTGGLRLEWGNEEVILELIEQIAYRRGFGNILADGTKKAAKKIGRGSEYYSKNVKGAEIIADLRLTYDVALAESVTPRGSCHLKGLSFLPIWGADYVPPEERERYVKEEIGSPYSWNPFDPSSHPWIVRYNIHHMAILDALELCAFPSHWVLYGSYKLKDLPPLIESATGLKFTEKQLRETAERIRAVQRAYNNRLGLRKEDDIPPKFVFERPLKGFIFEKEIDLKMDRTQFEGALTQFYKLFGYDIETGIPTRETLNKLGLEDVAKDLTKRGVLPKAK